MHAGKGKDERQELKRWKKGEASPRKKKKKGGGKKKRKEASLPGEGGEKVPMRFLKKGGVTKGKETRFPHRQEKKKGGGDNISSRLRNKKGKEGKSEGGPGRGRRGRKKKQQYMAMPPKKEKNKRTGLRTGLSKKKRGGNAG